MAYWKIWNALGRSIFWTHEGQTPTQGWKPPRKPQHCKKLFIPRETAKCTREPTFGTCSLGGNVCYGKDAENNHTHVLRNHMHTAENKQNYSFPKYLRVESLQKASKLYCRSKIEFRERKKRTNPKLRSAGGLQTERVPDLGSRTGRELEKSREKQSSPKPAVSQMSSVNDCPPHLFYHLSHIKLIRTFSSLF